MIAETPQSKNEIKSIAAYARYRLAALRHSPAARREVTIIVALMAVLYAFPFLSWWQRWTLPGSLQTYGAYVLPLALAWLWVGRYRLVLPELDSLMERFVDTSVLRFLLEEEPERPKRTFWVLWLGCVMTVCALWVGDPTFTCLAFVVTVIGIVGYRQGTQALRVAAFPLTMLMTMIPIPGIFFDTLSGHILSITMSVAKNFLQMFGAAAERSPEGNPIWISRGPGMPTEKGYFLFAAHVGSGLSEAGIFLLGTLWFLSLVNAPFRRKFVSLLFAILWIGLLVSLRLVFLGWLGVHDDGLAASFRLLSLVMMLAIAAVGQYIIMMVLRCAELRPWARFRSDRAARPDDWQRLELNPTPPAISFRLRRVLSITTGAGVVAALVAYAMISTQRMPTLPARIDVWHGEQAIPMDSAAQRDFPPGLFRVYTAPGRSTVNISIARVTSLNSVRAPYRYLVGPDGLIIANQEGLVPRIGEKLPVHALMITRDRDDIVWMMHWMQSPGSEPTPEPLDAPNKIAAALVLHAPLYVCDVWINMAPGADSSEINDTLSRFSDEVDRRIKAMK